MKEAPKPVSLEINGKKVEAPAGTSVFQAAAQAGVFIPHYCYHPDLSIAGVCRMCMVDIEKNPRLQISCNTPVAEGMVVRTNTEKVKETVKSVLELHLINHPLDCPICDKAGECKLQDFYRDYGLYESRMDYQKVHKPKAKDIGTIVLDSERCILCTRCVRFTNEVTQTNELGIFNRGDRSELRTFDDGPLNNDYTGNLADICPVGALTAKDFRFQMRVWFLDKTDSVCGQCAHGCNTVVSVNPQTKKLYRVEPRRNPEVNKSWICDTGRWNYHHVYEGRVKVNREKISGRWTDQTWNDLFGALKTATSTPQKIVVALSTQATNEEIVDTLATLGGLGITQFTWIVDEQAAAERRPFDGILQHRDTTANALGFEKIMKVLGIPWMRHSAFLPRLQNGEWEWLWAIGMERSEPAGAQALFSKVPGQTKILAHVTNEAPWLENATWVVPNTSSFEKKGTFINAQGRLQKLEAVLPWQSTARDLHALVHGIAQGDDRTATSPQRASEVFEAFVVEKLLLPPQKFKKFAPLGIALEEVLGG